MEKHIQKAYRKIYMKSHINTVNLHSLKLLLIIKTLGKTYNVIQVTKIKGKKGDY